MNDDEELGLAPIEDEDAGKVVAPELPFDTEERLIPVICSACRTRLHAGENQIGMWKKCPDCGRLNEIRPVPEKFILKADDPEAAGGYDIGGPEISRREIFRLRSANRELAEAEAKRIAQNLRELPQGPVVYEDETPPLEGMLNRLLKSGEEKDEERDIARRAEKINREVEAINRAVRDGKLEEHLTRDAPSDPAARLLAAKRKRYDAAVSKPVPVPPPLPPQATPAKLGVFPPPVPHKSEPQAPSELCSTSELRPPSELRSVTADPAETAGYLAPLLDPRCRARMIVLTVCGLVGNLFGEKARSMVWQVVFDKVYDQYPGYVYTTWESVVLVGSFWVGAFFSVIWLTLLFLFGISLFTETAAGRDRVERWSVFDLNFGFSYIGWTLLIFYLSGYPGFLIWQGVSLFVPEMEGSLIVIHYLGWFLCFPVLFLCTIESDSFCGSWPRKTLRSLRDRPRLWLKFYTAAAFFNGVPLAIMFGMMMAGTAWYDSAVMNSPVYYAVSSVLLTFAGFFVLFYFRLLGRTARRIRESAAGDRAD